MELDDIDRILSGESEIVPSSGFAESVMEAIRREAQPPQPIPFPWKRALAGILVLAALLILVAVEFSLNLGTETIRTGSAVGFAPDWIANVQSLWHAGANWVMLALALSIAALALTKRLVSG